MAAVTEEKDLMEVGNENQNVENVDDNAKDDSEGEKLTESDQEMKEFKDRLEQIKGVSEAMQALTQKLENPDAVNRSALNAELETLKQLAAKLMSVTDVKGEKLDGERKVHVNYPWQLKARGILPSRIKKLKIILKRATNGESFKYLPCGRGSQEMRICFKTEDHMKQALKILETNPLGMKIFTEVVGNELETAAVEQQEQTAENCTPLILLQQALQNGPPENEETYTQQLEWKNKIIDEAICATNKTLQLSCTKIVKDRTEGFIFKLDQIHPCPLDPTNADRYMVYSGVDKKAGELCLEFSSLGGWTKSLLVPTSILVQPIQVIKEFIQQSDKPLFNPHTKEGFWHSLMARSNHVGNVMLLVVIHTETEEQAVKECNALSPQLSKLYEGGQTEIVSLVLKAMYESSEEYVKVVMGNEYLEDETAGLKLRIYPKTFFWSNPFGAQILCETVAELLQLDENSAVVEVGCSTGIMGMYLSKSCSKVFMLDRLATSLTHAAQNAALNGIFSCEFLEGGLQSNVDQLRKKLTLYANVAAIISDTFNTKSSRDARLIRQVEAVDKLLYISMVNRDSDRNLAALCAEKGEGIPFVPVQVIPVDMNPRIVQLQVVFLLERRSALKDKIESIEVIETKKNTAQEAVTVDNTSASPPKRQWDNYSPFQRNRRFDDERSRGRRWGRDRGRRRRSRSRSRGRRGHRRRWSDDDDDEYYERSYSRERRRDRRREFERRRYESRGGGDWNSRGFNERMPDIFNAPVGNRPQFERNNKDMENTNLETAILNVIKKVVIAGSVSGNQLGEMPGNMGGGYGGFNEDAESEVSGYGGGSGIGYRGAGYGGISGDNNFGGRFQESFREMSRDSFGGGSQNSGFREESGTGGFGSRGGYGGDSGGGGSSYGRVSGGRGFSVRGLASSGRGSGGGASGRGGSGGGGSGRGSSGGGWQPMATVSYPNFHTSTPSQWVNPPP